MTTDRTAALGFAPHSGWAALVGIGLEAGDPRVLARERIAMADDPQSKQPYHAVEGLRVAQARRRLEDYAAEAALRAREGLARIVETLAADGYRAASAGILDSSGRKGTSLEAILASHALIHTADGDHFRDALASAARGLGLAVGRVRAKELEAEASRAIGRPPAALRATLRHLGRSVGPPWTADQKAATLLGWLLLTREPPPRRPAED